MLHHIRELPPVCLVIALVRLLSGNLRLLQDYRGEILKASDGSFFRIFRDIANVPQIPGPDPRVFIVSFKFSRLSHGANRVVSLIPMLIIAGFPGFVRKMYAVNQDNGYWQGMYQWKTEAHLARYRQSFVFRMMNKRALTDTVHSTVLPGQQLIHYVKNHIATRNC
jgi:hypothetical protein